MAGKRMVSRAPIMVNDMVAIANSIIWPKGSEESREQFKKSGIIKIIQLQQIKELLFFINISSEGFNYTYLVQH